MQRMTKLGRTIESMAAMADGRGGGRHGTVAAAAAAAADPRAKGEEATPGKDCRACTDFKSWAKMQRGAFKGRNSDTEATEERRVDYTLPEDCPLDKNQLGSSTWAFLHTMAAYYPDRPSTQDQRDMKTFFNIFAKFYPCEPCAADLRYELQDNQPDTSSRKNFSHWLCRLHNGVNIKLGKEEFDCSKVDERWRDGWKDGRCN